MTRHQGFLAIFLVIFVLLLVQLVLIFTPFLTPLFWAVILAHVAYPVYRRLLRLLKGRSNLSAALLTLGVTIMAVVPAVYVILLGIEEGVEAYERTTEWVNNGGLQHVGVAISQIPVVGGLGQEVIGRTIVSHGQFEASLLEGGKAASAFLASQGAGLVRNALLVATDFLVMLFALFFMFRDGRALYDRLYDAIPLEDQHKKQIFGRLGRTVTAVVRGTLLTALAQGAVAGVTYWALDVPLPVFLGALTALVALLPVGGTAFVWGPVAVYLIATGAYGKGLIMVAIGGGLVGLMDNILQPILIGASARLPLFFLFFASLGGLTYFGFLGLFLGPILLAVVLEAFQIYEDEFHVSLSARQTVPRPPAYPKA